MPDLTLRVIPIQIVTIYQRIRSPELNRVEFNGRYLMGRDAVGMPIRHRIEEIVTRGPSGTTYILDFKGVEDISSSVAEELGPILSTWFSEQSRPEQVRYVAYANLSEDVRFGFDDEFTRRRRVAVALSFDATGRAKCMDVLGQILSPPLHDIVQLCYKHGAVRSSDVEGESPASVSKKFTELHERYPGLVCRRKEYGTAGLRSWQYVYVSLVQPGFVLNSVRQDQAQLGA